MLEKRWPVWLKITIALFGTLLASEITLRLTAKISIFSATTIKTFLEASSYPLLILDNLILFLITLFLPIALAHNFSKNKQKQVYEMSVKERPIRDIISVTPPVYQYKAEGKGLLIGGIIAIIYSLLDFFLIKLFILPECFSPCGIENSLAALLSIIYIIMGLDMLRDKKKPKLSDKTLLTQENSKKLPLLYSL